MKYEYISEIKVVWMNQRNRRRELRKIEEVQMKTGNERNMNSKWKNQMKETWTANENSKWKKHEQ